MTEQRYVRIKKRNSYHKGRKEEERFMETFIRVLAA